MRQMGHTYGNPRMDDVISKLTAEQALKIVERLGRKEGKLREAVLTEAMNVLTEIDLDETADEVVAVLDSIDVQDCWDRSGALATAIPRQMKRRLKSSRKSFSLFSIKSNDIMKWACPSKKRPIAWE